jgi:hypothetical protein
MTGAAQRPALDHVVRDIVDRENPASDPVRELVLVMRLRSIHGGGDLGTQQFPEACVRPA